MASLRPTSAAFLWMPLCLCVASAVAQSPPVADPATGDPSSPRSIEPVPLTTDTVEYCGQLADELDRNPDAPQPVRELTFEGRQMCKEGHVIGGVARLRRAVMLLRQGNHPR